MEADFKQTLEYKIPNGFVVPQVDIDKVPYTVYDGGSRPTNKFVYAIARRWGMDTFYYEGHDQERRILWTKDFKNAKLYYGFNANVYAWHDMFNNHMKLEGEHNDIHVRAYRLVHLFPLAFDERYRDPTYSLFGPPTFEP